MASVIVTGAVTVRLKTAVFVAPPPVAVIVTDETPALAVDAAVNVTASIVAADPAKLPGEKAAVTPAGRPVAVKVTAEAKPVPGVNVSCVVAVPVGEMPRAAEEAVNVKEGAPTVTVTTAEFVTPPPVPVTVTL